MGFPIPGDAIEQRLDLNQYLIKRSAATFLMRGPVDLCAEILGNRVIGNNRRG